MGQSDESERWRKSSFSGAGDCVEWLERPKGVDVRDSKKPAGPVLRFTHNEWRAFLAGVRNGEADLSSGPGGTT